MKRIFTTIAITIIAATMAQAQLKVNSTGDVILPGTVTASQGHIYFPENKDVRFGCNSNSISNPQWSIQYWTNGLNFWKPSAPNSGDYKLFLSDNGNVGIGTGVPAYKFDCQGTARFGYLGFAGTGWEQVILDWSSNTYGNPTFYPKIDGNLNIGMTSNRVQVNAVQVWSVYFTNTSDERVKENITNLSSSLQKLKQLRGVKYDIKEQFVSKKTANLSTTDLRKNNIGFLAQELEKVFPELIVKSDSGLYGVNYIGLIPVLVEAIKEQTGTIDNLQDQVSSLNNKLSDLQNCCKSSGSKTKSNIENDNSDILTSQTTTAVLYQNSPNPFKQSTNIKLELPQTIANALVCIYDLTGRQLKCFTVTGRGNTSVQITASELSAGMYHYALIADGNLIDTKTMVLTE